MMRRRGGGNALGGGVVVGEGGDNNKGEMPFGFGVSRCRGECGQMGRGWIVFGRIQSRGFTMAPTGRWGADAEEEEA